MYIHYRSDWCFRSFEEEGKARLAIPECVSHNLLEPYNILYEKEGEEGVVLCVMVREVGAVCDGRGVVLCVMVGEWCCM